MLLDKDKVDEEKEIKSFGEREKERKNTTRVVLKWLPNLLRLGLRVRVVARYIVYTLLISRQLLKHLDGC